MLEIKEFWIKNCWKLKNGNQLRICRVYSLCRGFFFRNWVIGNNAPRIFIKAPRASKAGQMISYQPKMPVFHQRDFWQVRHWKIKLRFLFKELVDLRSCVFWHFQPAHSFKGTKMEGDAFFAFWHNHYALWTVPFRQFLYELRKALHQIFLKLMLLSRAFMIFAFAHSSRSIFLLRCGVVVCKNLSVQLRSTLGQKMHPRKFGSLQNCPAVSFFRLKCSVYINVENREELVNGDKKQRRPI